MNQPPPVRAVITGGPGAGKSTLLEAAAQAGFTIFPEVARAILQAPGGMALRAHKPAAFAQAMLDAQRATWAASATMDGPVLFARGFADIAGFLRLEGLAVPPTLDHICRTYRYSGPIFRAPPWAAIYAGDAERIQSWDEAVASDTAISKAWQSYGYRLVDLPLAPVAERLEFMRERLLRREP